MCNVPFVPVFTKNNVKYLISQDRSEANCNESHFKAIETVLTAINNSKINLSNFCDL